MNIEYPEAHFSEESVRDMWNDAYTKNPELYESEFIMRIKRPTLRYKMSRMPGTYFCAFKDGVIVAYSGWRDNGDHFKSNGARVIPSERRNNISKTLRAKKMEIFNSERKPSLVILDSKAMPKENWEASWIAAGWRRLTEAKDKLREWTGSDEVFLKYREAEKKPFVYFPTGFNKAWSIISNHTNSILQWEGY